MQSRDSPRTSQPTGQQIRSGSYILLESPSPQWDSLIFLSYLWHARHGHKLYVASVRKPLYFQEYPIRILSLPCQPRVQFKQHPFSTWTTFRWPLCTIYQLLLVALVKIFYIDIFSNNYSGSVVFNSFFKAVGEALHILLYISFSEFAGTSTKSTISYLVLLCLVSVALLPCLQFQPIFYLIDIFFTHIFLDFSRFTPRWRQRGKSSTSTRTFHSPPLLECTLLVILYWRGRGNFHSLFSRDWKSLFIKWNLL